MKKILYFAAVLSAFMTSCTNENEIIDNTPTKGTSTITASFDQPASRAQMGTSDGTHTHLQWNAGDQLVVYNATSHTYGLYQTASTVHDGAAEAVFDFVEATGSNEIIPAEPHLAVYPYAKINPTTFAFEYSSPQTYTANSFDPAAMPMVASNASGTAFNNFTAQAAVLRLKVSTTASDVTVSSIDIESASMALTGDATPNMTLGTYGVPTTNTGKKVTLNCTAPVAINSTAKDFNIVVPGQTYPSGDLTITVKTNKGDFAKTSKAEATFAAGKVYNLNISGEPVPTGTATRTGNVSVNWVQLWDGGPKFAEYNVGVTDGKAESYGGYYSWGGNVNLVGTTGTPAYKTGTDALTGDYDTATNLWGSNWRMPTAAELKTLCNGDNSDKCTKERITVNGVNGYKFTGKGDYASNSVFLPAAGYCDCVYGNGNVIVPGSQGHYWSSTPDATYIDKAQYLELYSTYAAMSSPLNRWRGYSVRAVLAEN